VRLLGSEGLDIEVRMNAVSLKFTGMYQME
jgi:hypothetical protein